MVLYLIVQPPVHKIDLVISEIEVGSGKNRSEVVFSTVGCSWCCKSIQILAGVVRHDCDEGMDVGNHISNRHIEDCMYKCRGTKKGERKRHQYKPRQKIRSNNLHEKFFSVDEIGAGIDESFEHYVGFCRIFGNFLALSSHFIHFQFFERVWSIVNPFPNSDDCADICILEDFRPIVFSNILHISLDQIRIRLFTKVVVMQLVVLQIPSLRKHPVKPISHTPV
mmetsp:Transcript_26214/g.46502  ORF Transcript_26214/g.46502 Transcript_26214/m.46502 type:complete len:223 (+) Transcript_26214:381-1049(+)